MPTRSSKLCAKCKEPNKMYYPDGRTSDGLYWECADCRARRGRVYKTTAAGKRSIRKDNLRRKYGIDEAQYQEMLSRQFGVCAICKQVETSRSIGRLSVDHSHVSRSRRVRGLLCRNCNTAIGMAKDSPAILASAIQYLLQHKQLMDIE